MNQKFVNTFKTLCVIWSALAITTCGAFENDECTKNSCCPESCTTIQGELLVWTAYQTNFDYCIVGNLENSSLTDARRHYLEYDWDTGFRIGAGFRIPCSCWEIRGVYTYFHTKATDSVAHPTATNPQGNPVILPVLVPTEFSNNPTDSAKAKINTEYDTIDILFSCQNCPYSCLDLTPYIGIRGLILDQNHKVILGPGLEGNNVIWVEGDGSKWKSDYKAVGLHAGVENSYNLCEDFNIFGNLSGSWLIGCYDSHEKFSATGEPFPRERDVREKNVWQGVTDAHIAIGITWESCICDMPASISLGYEIERLWGVPELHRQTGNDADGASSSNTSGATLTFHGGFLRGGISF